MYPLEWVPFMRERRKERREQWYCSTFYSGRIHTYIHILDRREGGSCICMYLGREFVVQFHEGDCIRLLSLLNHYNRKGEEIMATWQCMNG